MRADSVRVERVPGAWEIPVVLAALAATHGYDGLVALGAVVRGETAHFEIVAAEAARGAAEVARTSGVPVALGILACDTAAQALARAGGEHGNQGEEAALAALETAGVLARVREETANRARGRAPSAG